jgi:TetR/AcrR family transcriptional regulator, transcriptional repressor for nem operon
MIAIIQVAMRHSKEDKAASHERIVEVAAARIRESGTEQPGVAEIMRAAGLTHGGFYKHFESKDQLVAEACAEAVKTILEMLAAAASQTMTRQRARSPAFRDSVFQARPGESAVSSSIVLSS